MLEALWREDGMRVEVELMKFSQALRGEAVGGKLMSSEGLLWYCGSNIMVTLVLFHTWWVVER